MNTITCPLCGGTLSPADAGTRSQCDNCGAYVAVMVSASGSVHTIPVHQPTPAQAEALECDIRFDGFVRDVMRRSQFGRGWARSNLRPLFDAGKSVDEVLAMRPEGR